MSYNGSNDYYLKVFEFQVTDSVDLVEQGISFALVNPFEILIGLD